jgi:hypothetical protein
MAANFPTEFTESRYRMSNSNASPSSEWLKCSACKRSIGFVAVHFVCSVSTCNRNRMRLVFCTVACWDSHVASARHREAWAVEEKSPSQLAWQQQVAAQSMEQPASPTPEPRRQLVSVGATASVQPGHAALSSNYDKDVLIVVSKMKKYIKDRSGMNCSDAVADMLSEHVRAVCDESIRIAAQDGRKTVLDRDVPKPR